jgi:hypothetical protein
MERLFPCQNSSATQRKVDTGIEFVHYTESASALQPGVLAWPLQHHSNIGYARESTPGRTLEA